MKHPEGFTMKGKEEMVCRLKKSLYGLKQSSETWYQKFDSYIQDLGFNISQVEHCVYNKQVKDHFIYVALYVDDMFILGNNVDLIKEVNHQLSSKFDMKELGLEHFIVGMEIKRDRENKMIFLSQQKYIEGIMKMFNMQDCKSVKAPIPIDTKLYAYQCPKSQEKKYYMEFVPYANAVKSLMYDMVST